MKASQSQTPQKAQIYELQAVIFDLGGVIASDMEEALHDLVDTYSGQGAVSPAALHVVWYPLYREATLGLLHPDKLWSGFRKKIMLRGLPHGEEDKALLSRIDMREPRIPETIGSLRGAYRVGLLSNYVGRWARSLLTRFGVMTLFDAVVISSEVGVRKPEALIYRRTCEQLGVPPSRAAYIGDEEEDMIGAQTVGMLPVFIPGQDLTSSVGLRIDHVADVLTLLKDGAKSLT